MIRIEYGDLWGIARVTNEKVEIVVKPKYTKLYPYRDGKAQFVMIIKDNEGNYTKNGIEGFIDESGVEIQKREYIVD
jgi:hypothetical protein